MHTPAAASASSRPAARPCAIPGCPTHHSLHLLRCAKDAACTGFRYIVRAYDRLPRSPYGLGFSGQAGASTSGRAGANTSGQAALQPFIYPGFREAARQPTVDGGSENGGVKLNA